MTATAAASVTNCRAKGRGDNDWTAILKTLYEDAHYRGVFMYEVKKAEFPQLKACYDRLYEQYVQSKQ